MSIPVNLIDIQSGFLTASAHNANNDIIAQALTKALNLEGGAANTMQATLDMGSNQIVNVAQATSPNNAVNLLQLNNTVAPFFDGFEDLEQAVTDAQQANTLAQQAKNTAQSSASQASGSAANAATSADEAAASAETALAAGELVLEDHLAAVDPHNQYVLKETGKQLSTEDYTTVEKNKLAGIAAGATVNSTDEELRNRATHTGTQLANTISDFTTAASAAAPVQSVDGQTNIVDLSNNYDAAGTAASAVTAHETAYDHDAYTTHVASTANPHGVTAAQAGADPAGTAASAVTAHEAAADPHTQYLTDAAYDADKLREALLKEATLNLDFANNKYEVYEGPVDSLTARPFKDVLTFTRGSAASASNATGGISNVGVDDQRLVGNREGLLIEEQRTNLLLWSEAFDNAVWTKTDSTVAANLTAAPDGTITADKFVENSGTVSPRIRQGYATDGTTTYSFSIFVKKAERSKFSLVSTTGASANLSVDLVNKAITSTSGSGFVDGILEELKDDWFKVTLIAKPDENASTTFNLFLLDDTGSGSYTGDGTSGIFIWGAQLEQASAPSSYIKTEAAQVTRSADRPSLQNLSTWFNINAGTIVLDVIRPISLNSRRIFRGVSTINGDGFTDSVGLPGELSVVVAGFPETSIPASTMNAVGAQEKFRLAYAWDSDTLTLSCLGEEASSSGARSSAPAQFNFGFRAADGTSLNSSIVNAKYIPRALSAEELNILTAPEAN